jgi:hypothetical protein
MMFGTRQSRDNQSMLLRKQMMSNSKLRLERGEQPFPNKIPRVPSRFRIFCHEMLIIPR